MLTCRLLPSLELVLICIATSNLILNVPLHHELVYDLGSYLKLTTALLASHRYLSLGPYW